MVHIDFDSFSEEEKRLFRKVDEIEAEISANRQSMEPAAENIAVDLQES